MLKILAIFLLALVAEYIEWSVEARAREKGKTESDRGAGSTSEDKGQGSI